MVSVTREEKNWKAGFLDMGRPVVNGEDVTGFGCSDCMSPFGTSGDLLGTWVNSEDIVAVERDVGFGGTGGPFLNGRSRFGLESETRVVTDSCGESFEVEVKFVVDELIRHRLESLIHASDLASNSTCFACSERHSKDFSQDLTFTLLVKAKRTFRPS